MTNTRHSGACRIRWGAVAALALRAMSGSAVGSEAVGWVTEIEGRVEARHADGDSWGNLQPAAELAVGDHVRTAADSKAKLLLRDDSVLLLAPDSELTLDEQTAGPVPSTRLKLLEGKVRALVTERYGAPGSTFELQSVNAITGVRGTSFVASYDPATEETVVVGLIHTTTVRARSDASAGREVRLGPGQETRVRRGNYPTRPTRVSDATMRGLIGVTTVRPTRGTGSAPGAKGVVAEPRLPRRVGDRDGSPEGRIIDQPEALRRPGGVPNTPRCRTHLARTTGAASNSADGAPA